MNQLYQKNPVGKYGYFLFFILLISTTFVYSQPKNGYSYLNITKQTVGGTVEPGDVLEIRYSVHFPWGFNAPTKKVYKVRYYDNVPTNTTMNTGAADRLKIITNEGTPLFQYTLGTDADAGNYISTAVAPAYQVRINIGGAIGGLPGSAADNLPTNTTGGGILDLSASNTGDLPRWWTGNLFSTAFRVTVKAGTYGQTITMGGGRLYYSTAATGGIALFMPVPTYTIMIAKNDPLCDNKVGANFAAETGGTFGKAIDLNRAAGLTVPLSTYTYINNVSASQAVNDGTYAIVNNTSPRASTNTNSQHIPNCSSSNTADFCDNRMFNGHWDIIGDHTGQTTGASNAPPGSTTSGGYMLMVNADYVTSEAFNQTITGLCPNTTYEFSAWLKNICSTCGVTQNLVATNTPGVLPNLTFVLDDIDRYSTGEIAYSGNWVKRGFSFTTGANQSSVTFKIRNNSQGGGGNDWVMDDISIATCQPNLVMKPYGNASVCIGNAVDFSADVESIFSNYTSWRWEKSNDAGTTWINETSGTASPVLNAGKYLYTINHPSFIGDSAAHGDIIRLRVATTAANLNDNNCSFLAATQVMILVNNCQWVLASDITQFKAQQINAGVSLRWAAVNETTGLKYLVEKSTDQRTWRKITEVNAKVNGSENNYTELDPGVLYQTTYYRISMVYMGKNKYTHQVSVQPNSGIPVIMAINTVQNPFSNSLPFELAVPDNGEVNIVLFDMYGKLHKQVVQKVTRGNNRLVLNETAALSSGNYILMVRFKDQIVQKKILKTYN